MKNLSHRRDRGGSRKYRGRGKNNGNFVPLVEYCVKRLVDEPEAVRVEQVMERGVAQLNVRVAPNDVGKIIGRNGRLVNALRHLVAAFGAKRKQKVFIKIVGV
ncbi:MAG: KH domain-containing protein [Fimbriimonadales bacterium]|nr:KH domain-containing protein [Fimbriimonadales bacterium]